MTAELQGLEESERARESRDAHLSTVCSSVHML